MSMNIQNLFRNTKEALHSLRSGLSSAATNLSKKYEEMTATQSAGLTEAEDDRVSQGSTESRRQSETVTVDGLPQGKMIKVDSP